MTPEEEKDYVLSRKIQWLVYIGAAALLASGAGALINSFDVPQRLKEMIETKNDLQAPAPIDTLPLKTNQPR